MRKRRIIGVLMIFISTVTFSQIGIGTASPDASAVLDMTSTSQGVLIPRMTTTQREAIATPVIGLQVYDTNTMSVWSYNGAAWANGTGGPGKFVDGATPDIAYYEGKVGIGRNTFSDAHKLWVEGVKSASDTNTPIRVNADYTGTGTSTATYGLAASSRNLGTGTIDFAIATRSSTDNNAGGTMNNGIGSWPEVDNAGTISTAVGSWPQVDNTGTISYAAGLISYVGNSGTMTTAVGENVGIFNAASQSMNQAYSSYFYVQNNGTLNQAYGSYIDFYGTGTVTDSYALYISAGFNQGTGNNFAVYSASDADSYVEGSIGVGVTAPQQKVHISGAMRLEPQATAPAGTLGDLYVDTNGNLYFNDGSAGTSGWRPVMLGAAVP
jgi:hypothetical protein